MTNTISPFSQTPLSAEPTSATVPAKPPGVTAGGTADASESEAVTLSAAAQTTTQLLSAARDADGVDQNAVQQIRSALAGGTYNVAPEDLAQAIATVLKDSR